MSTIPELNELVIKDKDTKEPIGEFKHLRAGTLIDITDNIINNKIEITNILDHEITDENLANACTPVLTTQSAANLKIGTGSIYFMRRYTVNFGTFLPKIVSSFVISANASINPYADRNSIVVTVYTNLGNPVTVATTQDPVDNVIHLTDITVSPELLNMFLNDGEYLSTLEVVATAVEGEETSPLECELTKLVLTSKEFSANVVPNVNGVNDALAQIVLDQEEVNTNLTQSIEDMSLTQIEYTTAQVASGVILRNNEEVTVTGPVNNFIIQGISGAVAITFVAGADVVFLIPDGDGWPGDMPQFIEGKIYNVVYYKGAFYADGGR